MKTEHTPGSWRDRVTKHGWLVVAKDCLIASAKKEAYTLPETHERQDADARLIAAAPEMLKALISVQKYICGEAWDDTDISAVIEKATGKTWEELREES